MNVQKINSNLNQTTSFKATYPVVHWVTEDGVKYTRACGDLAKKLQRKTVSILNDFSEKKEEEKLREYVKSMDFGYRVEYERIYGQKPRKRKPKPTLVRSFYNEDNNNVISKYMHHIYMITGKNVKEFENVYAKDIGRAKVGEFGDPKEVVNSVVGFYSRAGLNYVNKWVLRLKDSCGNLYALNTKFKAVKNKSGKITGYVYEDSRFLPEKK